MANVQEIWLPIPGYEGFYSVSNTGKILGHPIKLKFGKNFRITKEKIKTQVICKKGYSTVFLTKDKKVKRHFVHRLVCLAFLPNPENKKQVNHKDSNKNNNNISNLEWCTNQENQNHAKANGLVSKGEKHWKSKLSDSDVQYIRANYTKGKGSWALAKKFNIRPHHLWYIVNNLKRI